MATQTVTFPPPAGAMVTCSPAVAAAAQALPAPKKAPQKRPQGTPDTSRTDFAAVFLEGLDNGR